MKQFDLVVVGSGSGLMVLEAALENGKKCAIVEKAKFGGTCLTKGCIPSKMLVYPADMIREAEKAERVGVRFGAPQVDWEKVAGRMWKQINYSQTIEHGLKQAENLQVYNGVAEFTGKRSMRVKLADGSYSEEFECDCIVLASGARSFIPPIRGIEQTGYVIPETFFGDQFPQQPWKSLIIVGGGAIGAEFAHIFSSFGTQVTVVEMRPRILATEEEEISEFVASEFGRNGITVLTNSKIVEAGSASGLKTLMLEDMITGEKRQIEGEEIFLASGVRTNSDSLHLEMTSVETDARGWIKTNEYLETTQQGIYAIGDINGKYQFRHKANYEAEILINNLLGGERKKACYQAVPWAIFTWPQVAHAGMTEAEVKNAGVAYRIGRNEYSQVAGGIAMGFSGKSPDNGFVKLIVSEDKSILGVHIVGPYAAILLQPFVYLMNANYKCEKRQVKKGDSVMCPQLGSFLPINDSMVIHPSLSELTAWALDNIDWDSKE